MFIVYVKDTGASINFFEKAFGLKRKFFCEQTGYAELDTGDTTLSFASHKLTKENLKFKYRAADESTEPLGMEIAFVVDSVKEAYDKAIASGAKSLKAPTEMPWGQTIAHLVCPDGTLVELCTRVEGWFRYIIKLLASPT